MKYIIIFTFIFLGLIAGLGTYLYLDSKAKKEITQTQCEIFSMESFKGLPNSKKNLEKYCADFKIKYTKKICHKALTDLVMTGKIGKVKKRYGDLIEYCFTLNDLSNFAIKGPSEKTEK